MNIEVKPSAAGAPQLAELPAIAQVGVIGAGQMGNGIAHVCALAGLPVVMLDVKQDALDKALATIVKNMDRQVHRGLVTEDDKVAAIARITNSTDYGAFGDADLIIEAATEKEDVKRAIFKLALPHLKPSCMIASNTSSISITRLGASTDRPEKFVGMHFMNPVPVMKLVEVIRGIATGEPTFNAVLALAGRLGKITAVSEDFPAFIVNRILVPMMNEAVYALYEGVGSVPAIDMARRQPSDGSAGIGRLHWSRHLFVDHAGAVRGPGGQQIPAVPAVGEVCRGRLAGPEDRSRLLRLHGDPAAPDPVAGTGSRRDTKHACASCRQSRTLIPPHIIRQTH